MAAMRAVSRAVALNCDNEAHLSEPGTRSEGEYDVTKFQTVLKTGAKLGVKQGLGKLPFMPALGPIDRAKAFIRAPSVGRLVWALFQDPRVPMWQKGAALSALAVVVSPLDLIQAIPVVGEISDVALALFILDSFIKLAPAAVVNEHIVRMNLQGKIPLRA